MTEGLEALIRALVREESRRGYEEGNHHLVSEIRSLREELSKGIASSGCPGFLTIEEAAQFSRHSADTLRQWVKQGRLSRCGTSRKLLVREDELRNLLTVNCPGGENVIDMEARVREILGER